MNSWWFPKWKSVLKRSNVKSHNILHIHYMNLNASFVHLLVGFPRLRVCLEFKHPTIYFFNIIWNNKWNINRQISTDDWFHLSILHSQQTSLTYYFVYWILFFPQFIALNTSVKLLSSYCTKSLMRRERKLERKKMYTHCRCTCVYIKETNKLKRICPYSYTYSSCCNIIWVNWLIWISKDQFEWVYKNKCSPDNDILTTNVISFQFYCIQL